MKTHRLDYQSAPWRWLGAPVRGPGVLRGRFHVVDLRIGPHGYTAQTDGAATVNRNTLFRGQSGGRSSIVQSSAWKRSSAIRVFGGAVQDYGIFYAQDLFRAHARIPPEAISRFWILC